MTKSATRAFALTAVLALAACGDSGTNPGTGDLSEQEAVALSSVVVSQALVSGFSAFSSAFGVEGPSGVIPFSESVSASTSCALGGSVSVNGDISGDISTSGGSSTVGLDVSMTHQGCKLQDAASSLTFTIDGAPNLTMSLDMSIGSDGSSSFTGDYDGAVNWDLDGRTGSCSLDVTFSGSSSVSGTASSSVSGTVCGESISG